MGSTAPAAVTAAADEIARFAGVADQWWDPHGSFRALHRLNPTRVAYVRDRILDHFGRSAEDVKPFTGLRIADIGCGGGLLAEPLTRLGAAVTAIDADRQAVAVARAHAAKVGLGIDYRTDAPETLAAEGHRFDAVVSMEVVEHVADTDAFLAALSDLTRPGGIVVLATINRTLKSLALAKVAAEYVLRWVPPGTHAWRKFMRPSELAAGLRRVGVRVNDARGMTFDPLRGTWSLSSDLSVNYLMAGARADEPAP